MIYPETLYGAICSGKDCSQRGKILAFNPAALGVRKNFRDDKVKCNFFPQKHLREHQDQGEDEVGEIFCRCCDRVKERFKVKLTTVLNSFFLALNIFPFLPHLLNWLNLFFFHPDAC